MIHPTEDDIGRAVVYTANQEDGRITSYNDSYVFVRYGSDQHSKATNPRDLVWKVRRSDDG